ncbi:hypothetical protein LXL04_030847 [Taraxacum kok-saghyz]
MSILIEPPALRGSDKWYEMEVEVEAPGAASSYARAAASAVSNWTRVNKVLVTWFLNMLGLVWGSRSCGGVMTITATTTTTTSGGADDLRKSRYDGRHILLRSSAQGKELKTTVGEERNGIRTLRPPVCIYHVIEAIFNTKFLDLSQPQTSRGTQQLCTPMIWSGPVESGDDFFNGYNKKEKKKKEQGRGRGPPDTHSHHGGNKNKT